MPDGDRFEKKLRGKGWRGVYRLGCSGAPIQIVADRVMRAAAHIFRTTQTDCFPEICAKLVDGVQLREARLFKEAASRQAFSQLSYSVEAIEQDEGYSESSRLGAIAALRTFKEIERTNNSPNEETVKQLFTRNLVWGLTERRCLGPIRDGIIQRTGRSTGEQQDWEAKLRETILEPCARLSDSLLTANGNKTVRAPRRLFKPAPVTLETLNQPLRIV